MSRIARSLLLLVLGVLLAGGCIVLPGTNDPTLRHEYTYEVSVAIDRPVDDLVLRVPLPSFNGSSALGEALVSGSGYGIRDGWDVAIVEANGTPLLELRVARFLPEYRGTPVAIAPGVPLPSATPAPPATIRSVSNPVLMPYLFGASIGVERPIETREPLGREPLLGGGAQPSPTVCALPGQETGVECVIHPVDASVGYGGDTAANVSVDVRVVGSNQWWRGGWRSTSYTDYALVEFPRGYRGWTRAAAHLTAGVGTDA